MLKLLIVKTSSLGDVIHNLPIIHDILQHHPDAEIDWLVEASFTDIPKLHPQVKQVIPVAIRRWRKSPFKQQTWAEIKAAKAQIQHKHYDLVLDTQGLLKSGLLTSLAHGEKHGYDKHSIREPIASCFYEHKHQVSRQQHAVARNRTLVALALGYPVPTNLPNYGILASARPAWLAALLQQPYLIGLHGTSRDSKLWPTAHWIALGKKLAAQQLNLLLPWASQAEHTRAQTIAAELTNATVLPKASIAELSAVISHAQAAVGVDTGLSHLAVALGTPTVAIYTDTNPALTGVYAGAKAAAVNLGNIAQIPSVDEVLAALQSLQKN